MRCPSDAQAALLALIDAEEGNVEWVLNDDTYSPSTARLVVERVDRESNRSTFDSADGYTWKHRNVTVEACLRHGWLADLHQRSITWPPTSWDRKERTWEMRRLDLTEDGVIALGLWRERKLNAAPADLPTMTDHEREVAELALRALELGYALCARKPARAEARRLRRSPWFDEHGCWVANSATGMVPTPTAVVEIRPDQADTVAMTEERDDGR